MLIPLAPFSEIMHRWILQGNFALDRQRIRALRNAAESYFSRYHQCLFTSRCQINVC